MLALLESEVTQRGGAFAFCDTDSLAIVGGPNCPKGIPSITKDDVDAIVAKFNALNPYNREIVPNLLKIEYKECSDLRCYAISAKRYVLFRWRPGKRIQTSACCRHSLLSNRARMLRTRHHRNPYDFVDNSGART